jgi:TP901 family phage tail tape measure protein
MPTFPVKLKLAAIDTLSRVLKKVTKGLGGIKKATQRASNAFKRFQDRTAGFRKKMASVGSTMKNVGKSMIAGITLPVAAIGTAIIGTAANFESAMNEVEAKTNFVGKSFADLTKLAKEMGEKSTFSATEAAKAQAFLAKAGLTSQEIFETLPAVLDLAAASQLDLATAADITSNIMGAFGEPASEATDIADILARTTAGANVDMIQLGETFKQAGPVAEKFGASLEDAAAAAGLLGNIGIQGSAAGTALKNAFLGLASPTSKARKLLEEMNVATADSKGNMLGFADIMKNLGEKVGDLNEDKQLQVLKELFGKIGIAGGSALAEFAKTGELEKFTNRLSDTTVTAKGMAKTMNKGAKGGIKAFKSALEGLSLAVSDSGLLESFTKLLMGENEDGQGGVVGLIRGFSVWVRENPTYIQLAATFALIAAAAGPLIFIIGAFVAILPGLTVAAGFFGVTLGILMFKIILITAIIGLLVVAGFFLVKNWETVKVFMIDMWTKIREFLDSDIGIIIQILNPFIGIPFQIIKNWGTIVGFFGQLWKDVDDTFKLSDAWDEFLKPDPDFAIWNSLPIFFEGLWAKISGIFTRSINSIQTAVVDFLKLKEIGQELGIDFGLGKKDKKPVEPEATEDEPGLFDSIFGSDKTAPAAASAAGGKNKSLITVDFKNLPKETKVDTKSTDDTVFNINSGQQGAAL